jgi:hypothetical protein
MLQMDSTLVSTSVSRIDPRRRVQVGFSDAVTSVLTHVSEQLGPSVPQLVEAAVLDALPALVERADQVKKRASELNQVRVKRK